MIYSLGVNTVPEGGGELTYDNGKNVKQKAQKKQARLKGGKMDDFSDSGPQRQGEWRGVGDRK